MFVRLRERGSSVRFAPSAQRGGWTLAARGRRVGVRNSVRMSCDRVPGPRPRGAWMTNAPTGLIDVRRADQRFHTQLGWLDSWHSFSFGSHGDPANVGHGLLVVNNDDTVRGGGGFATHAHRDMEIVTWVLS